MAADAEPGRLARDTITAAFHRCRVQDAALDLLVAGEQRLGSGGMVLM